MARPIEIRMSGYGPPDTSFSRALKRMGDRLERRFGNAVSVRYVWNIMDLAYRGEDILWLVESGVLSLGYQSSSYLTDRVPELGLVDLPFLFDSNEHARRAMDGRLGALLAAAIEARTNFCIIGWLENGFRHISNRLRPIRAPADLAGMSIRVLPSDIQARTFELLGARPQRMDLTEALAAIAAGTIDAQENPFANTVTYGAHRHHQFHTMTGHFYVSRPIFVHRPTFESWPDEIRAELKAAAADAVAFQRDLAVAEHAWAAGEIGKSGGQIIELSAAEKGAFARLVSPLHERARSEHRADLFDALEEARGRGARG